MMARCFASSTASSGRPNPVPRRVFTSTNTIQPPPPGRSSGAKQTRSTSSRMNRKFRSSTAYPFASRNSAARRSPSGPVRSGGGASGIGGGVGGLAAAAEAVGERDDPLHLLAAAAAEEREERAREPVEHLEEPGEVVDAGGEPRLLGAERRPLVEGPRAAGEGLPDGHDLLLPPLLDDRRRDGPDVL